MGIWKPTLLTREEFMAFIQIQEVRFVKLVESVE